MFASLFGLAAAAAAPPPLIVATYAYPAYDRRQALAPVASEIGAVLGRPVETRLYASPDALRDAIRAGEVDFAMTNLSAYAGVAGEARVRAIAVLDAPGTTLDRYRGVLLARRGTGINTLAALSAAAPRLRYAEVLPGSTSGGMVQAARLRASGTRPETFAATIRPGTHEGALAALLGGTADVAALAETPWRKLQADRPDQAAGLVELWRSEGLPPGPVVCVETDTPRCARVARRLATPRAAAAAAALARGWSETEGATRFVPVDPVRYRPFVTP